MKIWFLFMKSTKTREQLIIILTCNWSTLYIALTIISFVIIYTPTQFKIKLQSRIWTQLASFRFWRTWLACHWCCTWSCSLFCTWVAMLSLSSFTTHSFWGTFTTLRFSSFASSCCVSVYCRFCGFWSFSGCLFCFVITVTVFVLFLLNLALTLAAILIKVLELTWAIVVLWTPTVAERRSCYLRVITWWTCTRAVTGI